MTITQLDIRGFKCFKSLKLPLSPLSVLTGFNAAGKSTATQPLLLFAQAFRTASQGASSIALNGSLAAVGTVGDIVNRDSERSMVFGFAAGDGEAIWELAPSKNRGSQFMDIKSIRYVGNGKTEHARELCPSFVRRSPIFESLYNVVLLSPVRDTRMEAFPSPQGVTQVTGNVGTVGEFAPWWYVQCADDEVLQNRRHPSEERTTVRGQIDAWLGELFPGATVNVEAIAKTSLARLEFGVGGTNEWRRPTNIGYGFTYVFPLLVALLTMKPGQILVVDTPEGHLHPKAQSIMGMMLSYFAASGLQIIVESHSDHLLSGVRLGVRRSLIEKSQVALHFFTGARSENAVDIVSPTLDSEGAVDFWPDGFFDQAEKDLAELTDWKG